MAVEGATTTSERLTIDSEVLTKPSEVFSKPAERLQHPKFKEESLAANNNRVKISNNYAAEKDLPACGYDKRKLRGVLGYFIG